MGAYTGTLYAAWKGKGDDRVFYDASFDNAPFTMRESVPMALTKDAPALAVGNYTLYAAWTGRTTHRVFESDSYIPY